jgi:predicted MFS family arabinose efflux permease
VKAPAGFCVFGGLRPALANPAVLAQGWARQEGRAVIRDRAILLMAVGQTLVWAGLYYVFPALLLSWEAATGWSKAELTGAITCAVLLSGAAAPVMGRVIDAGLGPVLMGGCSALGGLALAALSGVGALWQFYALWAVIGLSLAGSLYEPCFVLVTRARGPQAKPAIVAITLVAGFAGTISFPLVHALAEGLGWRRAVVAIGLGVTLGVAPMLWRAASLLEGERRARGAPAGATGVDAQPRFLRRPAFWLLGFAFGLMSLVHSGVLQHLLPILDGAGVAVGTAVLVAACIGPMQVAGRLAMVWSERFVSMHGVALAAFAALALACLALGAAGSVPGLLPVFVLLFGGAVGVVSILRPVLARELLGERNFGAKSGALAVIYMSASAAAPYAGALIWGWGGYGAMLKLATGCAAAGAGCYLLARRVAAG